MNPCKKFGIILLSLIARLSLSHDFTVKLLPNWLLGWAWWLRLRVWVPWKGWSAQSCVCPHSLPSLSRLLLTVQSHRLVSCVRSRHSPGSQCQSGWGVRSLAVTNLGEWHRHWPGQCLGVMQGRQRSNVTLVSDKWHMTHTWTPGSHWHRWCVLWQWLWQVIKSHPMTIIFQRSTDVIF